MFDRMVLVEAAVSPAACTQMSTMSYMAPTKDVEAGDAFPHGTVMVMEDYSAVAKPDGKKTADNLTAFAAIAKKIKGDAAGQAALAAKVRNGGQGALGAIHVPPNPGVTDDEMKELQAWVRLLD